VRAHRSRRVLAIVNGNASATGGPRERDRIVAALRRAGADVDLRVTSSLDELAAAWVGDRDRRIVLVGGDGTVHAAVNAGAVPRDVALIPAGGANNIARSLRIPRDWPAAAALAVAGDVRPVDLIEATTAGRRRMVVESISVGFLAAARVRYHARNSTDLVAGARAGVAALARFHPLAARVTGGPHVETLILSQLFVANLPLYEFGLRVAPHADPTDATLDFIGIEAPDRRAVVRMLLDLRRGTHLERASVHLWRAAGGTIATHGCSPIVADSEDLGCGPVGLRAAPGALRLVRP
jgi:diacylglycerol kinase (ATP)